MAFTLRISFNGFCAFAPFRDLRRMFVFLLDQTQRVDTPLRIEPHFPVVRFSMNNVAAIDSDVVTGVWNLDHYHVELYPGGKPITRDSLQFHSFDSMTGYRSANAVQDAHSFSHVVSLEQACLGRNLPHPGELDQRFLAPRLTSEERRTLGARFLFNQGVARVTRLSRSGNQLVTWRFYPFLGPRFNTDWRQTAAAEVELALTVHASKVELRASDLETGSAMGKLTLRPQRGESEVRISVMNEESEVIIGSPEFPLLGKRRPRLQDRIFETYARLLVSPPPSALMPIPVAETFDKDPNATGAGGSPPCSPAQTKTVVILAASQSRPARGTAKRSASGAALPIRRGESGKHLQRAAVFLSRFGYLRRGPSDTEVLEGDLLEALLLFKQFHNLQVSEELDQRALKTMAQARCGLKDPSHINARRVEPPCPWPSERLTYRLSDSGPWNVEDEKKVVVQAIERGIDSWRRLLQNKLELKRVQQGGDVLVEWLRGDTDGGMGMDVIAHADYPVKCFKLHGNLPRPVHLDLDKDWGIGRGPFFDIETVVAHEMGHVLGLTHIPETRLAVMNPRFFVQDVSRRNPTGDDEVELEACYP